MVKLIAGFVAGFAAAVGVRAWLEDAGRAEHQQGMRGPVGWDSSQRHHGRGAAR